MKKLMIMLVICGTATGATAQQIDNYSVSSASAIKLNAPDLERGADTMKALDQRKSIREYADRKLSLQDLSDLLWAANGMNRPDDSKRTAPTAMNKQEIDVYACFDDGAYLYDAAAHQLNPVTKEDVRPYLAGQQAFAAKAPVILLIVSDNKRAGYREGQEIFAAYDAGIVSQNISLFCAGCGFGTVPRGFMDKERAAKALGLGEGKVLHLNHPVGYLK